MNRRLSGVCYCGHLRAAHDPLPNEHVASPCTCCGCQCYRDDSPEARELGRKVLAVFGMESNEGDAL